MNQTFAAITILLSACISQGTEKHMDDVWKNYGTTVERLSKCEANAKDSEAKIRDLEDKEESKTRRLEEIQKKLDEELDKARQTEQDLENAKKLLEKSDGSKKKVLEARLKTLEERMDSVFVVLVDLCKELAQFGLCDKCEKHLDSKTARIAAGETKKSRRLQIEVIRDQAEKCREEKRKPADPNRNPPSVAPQALHRYGTVTG